jgi:methylphosphotriester-DNA--protein-cysteine methyltransferase
VRLAIAWLSSRLRRPDARTAHPAVELAVRRIAVSAGTRRIAALRAETGLGDGRLIALFRQQVGVTPKRLARIHRLDRALGLLARGGGALAGVAAEAGYHDQPHMNAEFRELAGLTPREFLTARRYPNSLSLPEPG